MAAEDYFYEDEDEDDRPKTVACKRCGKTGLHWEDDGDGNWVLLEGSYKVHRCDMQKVAVDDFEVVE